jgi:hypothetical protein
MAADDDAEELFRSALKVFEGARYPLDAAASKVLRLMLVHSDGCDATICASGFGIRLGWYPVRHRYLLPTAAPVVSELFRLADTAPMASVRARIGPARIRAAGFASWSFAPRRLWMDASATIVSIQVRDAIGRAEVPAATDSLPQPIGFTRQFVDLTMPMPCPHCAKPAQRYRRLQDGSFVCPACSRSFSHMME